MADVAVTQLAPGDRVRMSWQEYDATDEQPRLTAVPHLVVEILSSDRPADMVRKAAKYAQLGLERYWTSTPKGPS